MDTIPRPSASVARKSGASPEVRSYSLRSNSCGTHCPYSTVQREDVIFMLYHRLYIIILYYVCTVQREDVSSHAETGCSAASVAATWERDFCVGWLPSPTRSPPPDAPCDPFRIPIISKAHRSRCVLSVHSAHFLCTGNLHCLSTDSLRLHISLRSVWLPTTKRLNPKS
jgi:hypothetical protein